MPGDDREQRAGLPSGLQLTALRPGSEFEALRAEAAKLARTAGQPAEVDGPGTLRGHPAEQQPGQPPHRIGRAHTPGACHASPPRHSEQAVPLAGLLRVVLHGLGEVLVEGHGLPPGNDCPPVFAAGFGSHIAGVGKAALRYIRSRDEHQP